MFQGSRNCSSTVHIAMHVRCFLGKLSVAIDNTSRQMRASQRASLECFTPLGVWRVVGGK